MGDEIGPLFIEHLNSSAEKVVDDAVYTFFIFQILRNQHPNSVKWWQNKMIENGYSKELNLQHVEIAYMYLSNFVADVNDTSRFLEIYNSEYR